MLFSNVINSIKNKEVSLEDRELLKWLGIEVDGINVTGEKALKEATVFACIRILSESVAKLPIKIYQDIDGTKKSSDHYLYNLLKTRPNPYMSSFSFFNCLETQRNIYGNSYALIEGDGKGKVKGLWPLKSKHVEIWIDDNGLLDSNNKMWYVVKTDNNKEFKLKSDQILHFKGFTLDGITGITPLTYLRNLVENGEAAKEYINKFFKNGMQSKGIIHYMGDLNREGEEIFRKRFERMSSGLNNAHRVSLLPIGYQYQPISLSLADNQFLENNELTIRQIASAFGIKMHQLNNLERSTHNNISEQQRQFYIDTLMAILIMYEQELTYKLLLDNELAKNYYCRFNVDAIVRADIETRYEGYSKAIQNGFMTPNEVRNKEELEPRKEGDKLLINGNFIPVEMAGAQYERGEN